MIAVLAIVIACASIGVSLYSIAYARRRAVAAAGRRRFYVVAMPDGRYMGEAGQVDASDDALWFTDGATAHAEAERVGGTVVDA